MSGPTPGRWLVIGAGVAMIAAVVAGMSIVGTPSHQRALRLDERRVGDLRALSMQIGLHFDRNKALPATLAAVDGYRSHATDPITGAMYRYDIAGPKTYRLCATFDAASEDDPLPGGRKDPWAHGAGAQCFARGPGSDVAAEASP